MKSIENKEEYSMKDVRITVIRKPALENRQEDREPYL